MVSLPTPVYEEARQTRDEIEQKLRRKVTMGEVILRGIECLQDAHYRGAWLSPLEAAPILKQRINDAVVKTLGQFIIQAMPETRLIDLKVDQETEIMTVAMEGKAPQRLYMGTGAPGAMTNLVRKSVLPRGTRSRETYVMQKMIDSFNKALGPHLVQMQKISEQVNKALGPHLVQVQKMGELADEALRPYMVQTQKMNELVNEALGPHLVQMQKMNELANEALRPYMVQMQKMGEPVNEALGPHLVQMQKMGELANEALGPHLVQMQKMNELADEALRPYMVQMQKMGELVNEALGPHSVQMQKISELADEALRPFMVQMQKMNELVNEALGPLSVQMQKIGELVKEDFKAYIHRKALDARAWLILRKTGWVPYSGYEDYLQDVDVEEEPHLAAQCYEKFVDEKWPWIREEMEKQLADCIVDEDTRTAFSECLDNHEDKRYISVCRCLFAENERAIRVQLGKKIGGIDFKQKLKGCQDQLKRHNLYLVNPYSFHLSKVFEEMYESVRTEEDFKQKEPNLNRHIGLHGLLLHSFKTKKDSFNALALALHWYCYLSSINIEGE